MKSETTGYKYEQVEDIKGNWTLCELEPANNGEQRWSVGVNGPRAYLQCDEKTARLIVAAPELLEACKAMVASYEAYDCVRDDAGKPHTDYAMAKAAIAKAQGEQREGGV